jgi:basic membrane lipoprotein Med (substrate-binding protein (PBP1-ABC) superfamily)
MAWRGVVAAAVTVAAVLGLVMNPAAAEEKLKVAAVFETPIEEPWVNQIHVALLQAKKEFGIEYTWSESVKAADFARVLHEYAQGGYDLIMGDSFGTERITRRVAKEYPKVAFVFGSGLGPAEPNFSVFDNWIHEPAYLSGVIAGKLTKSNVIGTVAAMPIPEVNRPKAKEAALAQIEAGVDVIYAERFGVIEAAQEKGIAAIGNMSDQSSLSPETVVTSVVWDMWPTVKQVISLVKAGVYTSQDFGQFSFMGKQGSYLAPYHAWDEKLPAEVKQLVVERRQDILDGNLRIDVDEGAPTSE